MTYTVPHYIDGHTQINRSTQAHSIFNPATGEPIGRVYHANQDLCNQAIDIAKTAWLKWSCTSPTKRASILFEFRTLVRHNQPELAKLITREHGKTYEDAKASIMRAIELIEYHCGLVTQLQGTFSADVSQHMDCYTIRQPLGVCVGISPFNFPIMTPIWMMIPAIACGNTFILKPSEQAPSATLRLFELLNDAGLPPGVANCIQGDQKTAQHLITHPDVATVTAIASTPVARSIYQTAIQHGKRAHTFGGAKNHAVIMPDADFATTAKAILGAAFGSAGERCMAISALVTVGKETAKNLLNELVPLIQQVVIDAGDNPKADFGPLISAAHKHRVIAAVTQGVGEGARLVVDGRDYKHPSSPNGFFMGPCLFDNVTKEMSIYQNELFGPVLVLLEVETLDEAIDLVSSNPYGNGTAIFTQNGGHARHYSHRVQIGMVGINIPIPVPIVNHPFGGWKNSVFGDTAMHGLESLHFYTKTKTITTKWQSNIHNQNDFVLPENG